MIPMLYVSQSDRDPRIEPLQATGAPTSDEQFGEGHESAYRIAFAGRRSKDRVVGGRCH